VAETIVRANLGKAGHIVILTLERLVLMLEK
jgi:hypothetical protein